MFIRQRRNIFYRKINKQYMSSQISSHSSYTLKCSELINFSTKSKNTDFFFIHVHPKSGQGRIRITASSERLAALSDQPIEM